MCGNRLTAEDFAGGRVTCPACGAEIAGRPALIDPEAARQKARPPAIGLTVAGALLLLSGLAGPAKFGAMFAAQGIPAQAPPEDRTVIVLALVAFGVAGLIALVLGGTVALAGYRMYHLRSRGLAITASVLSIVSCLGCNLYGLTGVIALPALPLGIWALVVLNDPKVRAAFR
jgi:hypothetical protein